MEPIEITLSQINATTIHFYYYPMKEFSVEDYLDIIDENRNHIELYNKLLNHETQLHNELINLGYKRNFGEFLVRVYKKDLMKGLNEYKINKGIIKK